MNKENAHLYLPLVQALVDGRDIQWGGPVDGWADVSPNFTDAPENYRIKPKPRDFWIAIYNGPDLVATTGPGGLERNWIHVREVL